MTNSPNKATVTFAMILAMPGAPVFAQARARTASPDPAILAAVNRIRAIDNHAHPVKVVLAGEKPDTDYDALPTDAMQPFVLPARLRTENPVYIQAWRELFGYPYSDASTKHLKELLARKQRKQKQLGSAYCNWILDRLGIQTQLANRVAQGRGLARPRFQWVPFDDPLLFPLDNSEAKSRNSEYASMYRGEELLLKRFLADAGLKTIPDTLDDYLRNVVDRTLERQRAAGAVAIKFEAAYLRGLDFPPASEEKARQVYAQFASGGVAPPADYKALQDYLMHRIALKAGTLGMAVHFHTGAGVGAYFDLAGADPLKLVPLVDDPKLRKTNFVLLHGGWPFEKSTGFLLSRPNVYADFSYQTFILSASEVSRTVKTWLSLAPEKVLFATVAAAITDEVNWEEVGWLSNRTARRALAIALTELVNDGEMSRPEAVKVAGMVLRGNAAKLYKLN